MQGHINGMTNLKCLSQINVSPNYIQTEETSETTYPFGKGGFSISSLEEETTNIYLDSFASSVIDEAIKVL